MEARVTGREVYARTAKQWVSGSATAEEHGGRLLVCGGYADVLRGDWNPKNPLVVEFGDKDSLNSWVGSDGYAGLVDTVSQSADLQVVAVDGA